MGRSAVSSLLGKAYRAAGPVYYPIKQLAARNQRLYDFLAKLRAKVAIEYPESALAHKYLDGLKGIEIGASAANRFGLNTLNINFMASAENAFRYGEEELAEGTVRVDIVAHADQLPLKDNTQDFLLASHVVEHFQNPIAGMREWYRVVRPGGYLFLIVPHKERTLDKPRPRSTLNELIARDRQGVKNVESLKHHSVWITEDFLELCRYLDMPIVDSQDKDDKAGNGFTVVIQKPH